MKPASIATHNEVRRQQLRDGLKLSTQAKVGFFEEMVALAVQFGAYDRLRAAPPTDRRVDPPTRR